MRFLVLTLLLTLTTLLLQAQAQENPRFITMNGKTYDLKAPTIDKEYPYEVALKTASKEEVSSCDVFSNGKRPVVLVFWLTTCVPCQYELAAIKKKYEGWKEVADFDFYAISMDFEKRAENVYTKIANSGWQWETYYDYKRQFTRIMPGGLNGMPQTFIIDKNGKIAYHKHKYRMGQEDELFEKIIDLQ